MALGRSARPAPSPEAALLWEHASQRVQEQLHPAVAPDGQEADDLRAGGNHDCCDGELSAVHGER